MSDAAVTTIVTGLITIVGMITGFLTMWVKLQHAGTKAEEAADKAAIVEEKIDNNAKAVESKLDQNTAITTQVKEAATKASEHAVSCDSERTKVLKTLSEHNGRIGALETQMAAVKALVDSVSKNIDSSRGEMRGHLQTLTNKLDLMAANMSKVSIEVNKNQDDL